MSGERAREMEPTIAVQVRFRQDTLDRIGEAAGLLGLDVPQYIGVAATAAAKEDLGRADRLRITNAGKEE